MYIVRCGTRCYVILKFSHKTPFWTMLVVLSICYLSSQMMILIRIYFGEEGYPNTKFCLNGDLKIIHILIHFRKLKVIKQIIWIYCLFAPLNKIKRRQLRRCNPHHEITSSLKIAHQAANPSRWCVMQTIYVHLFTILFICLFLYRMCWNFYIWGGGGMPFKKINCCLFVKK